MAERDRDENNQPANEGAPEDTGATQDREPEDEDFRFALRELLAACQPLLEEDLRRAQAPDQLEAEEQAHPPNCEDEIALGERIFGKFLSEDVAMRLLPPEGRRLLGPIERWRWCLSHVRCCLIFGWLICRGCKTFRAAAYYVYRYWICVRQALDAPVHTPLTEEERHDFQTLIQALAAAYRPYLTDQLASVEFSGGIPDEVLTGKIDCLEGEEDASAVFERFLSLETAPALLGREAFEKHREEPFFWFCRCWCLCAIRFGCCLARTRNFIDVLRCLRFYRDCLRDCFRPLTCEINRPAMSDCAEEQFYPGPNVLGIEIVGTALGAYCDHYTLEWKEPAAPDTTYTQAGIVYASPAPPAGPGACGKHNAPLGYLTTTATPIPDAVMLRLCVFGVEGAGAPVCCTVQFQIFRQRVWITAVEGVLVESPPGVLNPVSQLKTAGQVRSFGTALEILGRAWVGKCAGREIKRYTLSYQAGFVLDPVAGAWTDFWHVDYLSPLQRKEIQTNEFDLISYWLNQPICLPPPLDAICFPKDWLLPTRWQSGRNFPSQPIPAQSFPVDPQAPLQWTSAQLPLANCQSGRYTLRLDVEDTAGFHYYDLQQIWFDNKEIHGKISSFAGVDPCATVNVSQFAAHGGDCSVPWLADIRGIAYDELIEEGNTTIPSDNYALVDGTVQGGYLLWIKKDGAPDPGVPLHIPGPGAPPWGGPYGQGTKRVGDPGVRCATASPPPTGSVPPETPDSLAILDLRRLDAVCNPGEPALTLKRGECCGYVARLLVFDNSVCPSLPTGHHAIEHHFPFCICNDLPARD